MKHKLIDIKFDPKEKKKLRKWSASCCCKQWNVMAPTEKKLHETFNNSHKREIGIRL